MQQFGQVLFIVGLLIAFLAGIGSDKIPVMFAVLEMSPDMSHGQWLLVTLTAGVGGSMLSIGSTMVCRRCW